MIPRPALRFFTRKLRTKTSELAYLESYWPKAIPWYKIFFSRFTLKMYRTVCPFLQLENALSIIEIGGGLGFGAEILLPYTNKNSKYILTNHVQLLADLAKERDLPNVEIMKVDPLALPFSGECFDRFIAMSTIEELKDAHEALIEAYRVLKPGGIMAASVSCKNDLYSLGRIFHKLRFHHGLDHHIDMKQNLGNSGSVRKAFKDAGFDKVFVFTEAVRFDSLDIDRAKEVFLEEPIIKQACLNGGFDAISKSVENEIKKLFYIEEAPLSAEFLLVIAVKL